MIESDGGFVETDTGDCNARTYRSCRSINICCVVSNSGGMGRLVIEYVDVITRKMVRMEPNKLFVFGDNMVRMGFGGQAKEMRGEPNSVGIPTKRFPSNTPSSFFRDGNYDDWLIESIPDILRLYRHEGIIVWPGKGIGTGLAQLRESSPRIWNAISFIRKTLE